MTESAAICLMKTYLTPTYKILIFLVAHTARVINYQPESSCHAESDLKQSEAMVRNNFSVDADCRNHKMCNSLTALTNYIRVYNLTILCV